MRIVEEDGIKVIFDQGERETLKEAVRYILSHTPKWKVKAYPNWHFLKAVFHQGATYSGLICQALGINPWGHGFEWRKTRYKDRNGNPIYEGDLVHVAQCDFDAPISVSGGELDYEGYVDEVDHVLYEDGYGEHLRCFPKRSREIISHAWERKAYGGEKE